MPLKKIGTLATTVLLAVATSGLAEAAPASYVGRAVVAAAEPPTENAQPVKYVKRHVAPRRYVRRRGNAGAAVALGLFGAAVGAAVANSHRRYYDDGYYGGPYYGGGYYGRPYYGGGYYPY